MKPAKLKRHFTSMHLELTSKPKEYFERQKEHYLKQKGKLILCTTLNEMVLRASYLVALRIARSKKPHTIAEELILPSAIDMCEVVLGREYSQKLKAIPLSDNTVSRRIVDMSEDVLSQLIARLQHSKFAIQLDERLASTQCVAVCTDGAAVMTGSKSGLVARSKQAAPHIVSTHCMIHREALAANNMNEDLADALSICIKIVNFVKAKPLNHRLFENMSRNGIRT
ncbi:SCAN domain-containing protein 3 [Thelohanellus kitauei]|uniref:SCAN domain-containing protein 3 n=1 Tax=Thelohanellus kitauei TaxID=669202 RepID=A0A0C2JV36_THEKT|nr:SCAN domain-containing protein 3 [Thelohanellus kitauei]